MICLIGCQRKRQSAGGSLEPAGGNCTVNGDTGSCQGSHRAQSKICRVSSQNDVPVSIGFPVVIGIDTGDTDAGLCTAVSLGEEYIVFLQGETVQHHTGRKDYLVISLIRCQRKCQSAGAGLEPAGGDFTVNGDTGSFQR